jgi:hypothetical protein
MLEDAGLGQAIARARFVHSGNFLDIGVGEIGVRIVSGIIAFLGIFGAVMLVVGAVYVSPSLLIPAIVVAALLFMLVMAFTMYLRVTYYTCLYLWAAAAEEAGQKVAAPAPLQGALAAG